MKTAEVHDSHEARRYVLQGLLCQRARAVEPRSVRTALEWALEIASSGEPLPATGFVADVGHIAVGTDWAYSQPALPDIPGFSSVLVRSYEDYVLNKLQTDALFSRAADACQGYAAKDRVRGVAYLVKQIRKRAGVGGVELSPAVIRNLINRLPDSLLAEAQTDLLEKGPQPLLLEQYQQLVSGGRLIADVLAFEDVLALEQRTALASMSQYVAHRQILQQASELESRLSERLMPAATSRPEVPTSLPDEDLYPVGGYASLANRGAIENLLHSQLAYMEPHDQPDLFDLKFLRNELLFYARDDNQFYRRRTAILIVLDCDPLTVRYKDPELPVQRIVLALAVILALYRRLNERHRTDSLRWELLLMQSPEGQKLDDEAALLKFLFRDALDRGSASIDWLSSWPELVTRVQRLQSRYHLQGLLITTSASRHDVEGAVFMSLRIDGPAPQLDAATDRAECAYDAWVDALRKILVSWR